MRQRALRRIANQGLLRGWGMWHHLWSEKCRRLRLMKHAAAKMTRPKLVRGFDTFKSLRAAAKAAEKRMGQQSQLDEAERRNAELEAEVERLRAEVRSSSPTPPSCPAPLPHLVCTSAAPRPHLARTSLGRRWVRAARPTSRSR